MSEPEIVNWWDDESFQDKLTVLLVRDPEFLSRVGSMLSADDFRPVKGVRNGDVRWLAAERALAHWERFREPLGKLARADAMEYATSIGYGANQLAQIRKYYAELDAIKPTASSSIAEKVVRYKSARLKTSALEQLNDLYSTGQLTDEKWEEITRAALDGARASKPKAVDYLNTLDDRQTRRRMDQRSIRVPWTFIEPLDSIVRCVGPKQLGLILAPYKRGKSTMLLWLAVACARQRFNVLVVTLEDARTIVEDRLDAIATGIKVKSLVDFPRHVESRFTRFRSMIAKSVKVYDGTEEEMTVRRLEEIVHEEREGGFIPDVLIVDYDEKISPKKSHRDKRAESDEVYNDLMRVLSRNNLIGWTAAQTQRDTRGIKILTGDKVAEDIGKIRKVTCAISLGKGEWTKDSIFLWVAAHKCDKMDRGCEIVPDLDRQLIYDAEATRAMMKEHGVGEEIS